MKHATTLSRITGAGLFLFLLTLLACQGPQASTPPLVSPTAKSAGFSREETVPGTVPGEARVKASGGELLASAQAEGEGEEDDELEKYWGDITFGKEQFDEVLQFIEREYIEEKIDSNRAYVSAANFVLSTLEPPYEMIPDTFYKTHKGDGEQTFQGGREEILVQRREFQRTRFDELKKNWEDVGFGQEDFLRVLAFAEKEAHKAPKPISSSRLWLSAVQGFLYALDPHSSLVSIKAWEESTEETKDASFDGIGALLTQRFEPAATLKNRLQGKTRKIASGDHFLLVQLDEEDKLQRRTFVESPMAGQPAEKAGVWAGDEIVKVNGEDVVDVPLDKVVSKIRGPRDTEVTLTVLREGNVGPMDIKVVRSHIRVTNVDGRILENYPCIGYVKLTGFIETSFSDLKDEVERLNEQCEGGIRGLVFDMRNNSGGLLSQGVRISDYFIPEGKIVTVKNRRKGFFALGSGDEVYNAHRAGTLAIPVVTLVNDGSASAAEIVASALQDNQRSLIVGERTFGKASVQTLLNPSQGAGYYVKLTIARYFSPSGRTLQVVGVTPDFKVAPEVSGEMPMGFREEDLSNHLPKIDSEYSSPNADLAERIKPCIQRRGLAERIFKDNPHPQIKFDFQLYSGADVLECVIEDLDERDERPESLYLPTSSSLN